MADRESRRTCFKCGCSPAADGVKLFRFPKPAVRNLLRCELWAKYIFPDRNPTLELQSKLYSEHRMLCHKHFKADDFVDYPKKLIINSVPTDEIIEVPVIGHIEPQAGPSNRTPFMDVSNTIVQNTYAPNKEPVTGTTNYSEKENIEPRIRKSMTHNEKEKVLLAKCSKYMRKTYKLQNRIKKLKGTAVLKAISDDECVKKLNKKLTPAMALLLQSQIRNHRKKITGRRWLQEDKILGLRIMKRSPTCYRLLRRLINLPAPSTLKSLLNKVPFGAGINKPVFEVLKNYVRKQKPTDNNYILMFDEMSLKKHYNYNQKEDRIDGYEDHAAQGRSKLTASYALVFMVAGIRKRVKQPIAHYFSSGFSTADRLAVLIKEVLYECFQVGINIEAMVCDMDGVNRRAMTILGASAQYPSITVHNKEIQTLFDPPHLLKCFRNMFIKYNIECAADISTVENKTGKGIAKWSYVKEYFEKDNQNPNFVFSPALTKEHLEPNTKQKMKVKLAAQVFSHSVAAGMFAKVHAGELPADAVVTANLISNIDKLFDALNSDQADLRRGKLYATNMSATSVHLKHFAIMKKFFNDLKYIGSPRKPPSQEGWIWTLNAVERLWRTMTTKYKATRLATRRLQQDPIENLFGCIRGYCGSNTNPTTGQFTAGLKTAILNKLQLETSGNCETDNNVVMNNLTTLLSVSSPRNIELPGEAEPHTHTNYNLPLPDTEEIFNEQNGEILACAYVCGFLIKEGLNNCKQCKNIFMAKNIESHHAFIEWREYSEIKKSLTYSTKNFVSCVECCATLINDFLKENAYKNDLKKTIVNLLKTTIDFNFLNSCTLHKQNNINNISINVFYICIRRFTTLENRKFIDEAKASALKKKIDIVMHR